MLASQAMHLCASCHRHVKASPCPFCGGQDSLTTLGAPPAGSRLSRAQLVAGAALVATVAACAGSAQQPDPGVSVAVYGAPAAPDPTTPDAGGEPQSATPPPGPIAPMPTGAAPMYGAPPN